MNQSHPVCRAPLFTLGALCLGLLPQVVLGSAWTRPDGGLLLLAPVAYTQANEAFDEHGDRMDRNHFEMVESSPLVEYGVTDSFTVGMQPKFRRVSVETANGTVTNSGLAETDLFIRQRLWKHNQASTSIQALVKLPIEPDENHVAALGRDQVDAAVKLAYGNRHSVGAGRIFYSAETGYRRRWELPDDEISLNAFIGWSPGGSWSFIVRSANVWGVKEGEDIAQAIDEGSEVLTTGPSFVRHDAQLMTSYKFRNAVSLVGGVATTYAGENVGVGETAFLAVTLQF
jgi:hypothetical protein